MKHLAFVVLGVSALLSCDQAKHPEDSVNSIIGNRSFVERFGYEPGAATDETLRIRTHLEYAETMLRSRDVSSLPANQRKSREHLLDLLHEYWIGAAFPKNYDYAERKPCFIDRDGNICAVGYLVEQTAGRAMAEQVNNDHQYSSISDMTNPSLLEWVGTSGLSIEELGIIQPAYGWNPPPNPNYIPKAYGASSAAVAGANLSFNVITGVNLLKGNWSPLTAGLGLLGGSGQLTMGIVQMSHTADDNETLKALCYANIGMGTFTLMLNTYSLLTRYERPARSSRSLSWTPITQPGYTGFAASIRF